jgi:hypothetical protein
MLSSILVVGSIWFWALMVASFLLILFAAEVWDAPFVALTTIVATFVIAEYFFDIALWSWVVANPFYLFVGAGTYIIVGAAWSFVKWYLFLRNYKELYTDEKIKYLRRHNIEGQELPSNLIKDFKRTLPYKIRKIPQARSEKGRILTWMGFWPWSVVHSLFADIFRQIFVAIYSRLSMLYDKISQFAIDDIQKEMAEGTDVYAQSHEEAVKKQDDLMKKWSDRAREVIDE